MVGGRGLRDTKDCAYKKDKGMARFLRVRKRAQRGEATMEMKFDIFLRLPDGKPLWVEAVEGYEKAKVHVQELIQLSPGEYFIFNSRTGQILRLE